MKTISKCNLVTQKSRQLIIVKNNKIKKKIKVKLDILKVKDFIKK